MLQIMYLHMRLPLCLRGDQFLPPKELPDYWNTRGLSVPSPPFSQWACTAIGHCLRHAQSLIIFISFILLLLYMSLGILTYPFIQVKSYLRTGWMVPTQHGAQGRFQQACLFDDLMKTI